MREAGVAPSERFFSGSDLDYRMICTTNAGQSRTVPTHDLVMALLMACDEAADHVCWLNPVGTNGETHPGDTVMQGQSQKRGRHQWWC